MFSSLSKLTLAKAALFQNAPVYVQFYVTARCNLTCEQCNIIYANSDVRECTIDEIKRIADNFARMGVAIVLLTGGEPFARKDLPEIIHAFESRGVHVRMQTNGFASEEQIARAVEAGGKDISISLDSLQPARAGQDQRRFQRVLASGAESHGAVQPIPAQGRQLRVTGLRAAAAEHGRHRGRGPIRLRDFVVCLAGSGAC